MTSGVVADLLLDTDIFIDHLRGAAAIETGRHRIHYSVITRTELIAGTTATDLVTRLLAVFREIPVDRSIADRAGRVAREFGTRIPYAIIAATAIERGLGLVTRNRKDFQAIRGLRIRMLH